NKDTLDSRSKASHQFIGNRVTRSGDILRPHGVSAISSINNDVSPRLDIRSAGQIDHHRIHRYAADDRRGDSVNQNAPAIGKRKRNPVVVAHRNYPDPEIVPRDYERAAIADSVALFK